MPLLLFETSPPLEPHLCHYLDGGSSASVAGICCSAIFPRDLGGLSLDCLGVSQGTWVQRRTEGMQKGGGVAIALTTHPHLSHPGRARPFLKCDRLESI